VRFSGSVTNIMDFDMQEDEDVPADGGVFQRADDAVLKTRKIARVKRRSQDPTSQHSLPTTAGGTTTNPFASVTLTAPAASSLENKAPVPAQGGGFGSLAAKGGTGGGLAFGTSSSSLGFGSLAKNDQNGGLLFGKSETAAVTANTGAQEKKEEQEPTTTTTQYNKSSPSDSILTKGKSVFGQPQQEKPTDASEEIRTTGEEGEDTLHATNVSLFEFQGGQWKERGKGLLKVNKNKDTKACRLIMRQQGNLKLLLNANVWKGMKVSSMEESKGMSFSCINHLDDTNSSKTDESSDQSALGLFAIRSRDATAMNEIYNTVTATIDAL
jgi:hypothetical protein